MPNSFRTWVTYTVYVVGGSFFGCAFAGLPVTSVVGVFVLWCYFTLLVALAPFRYRYIR